MTKKQHYVPQFYLRQWVDVSNGFYPIKIRSKAPPELIIFNKKSNPSRFCFENFFYASETGIEDEASQLIEKSFAEIEGSFSEMIPSIETKLLGNEQITFEDKYHLSEFMIFLWLRGKNYRSQSQRMTEDMIKKINKLIVHDIDKSPASMKEMMELGITKEQMIEFTEKGEYIVKVSNFMHLALMNEMGGFCNLLSAKYWKVFISRAGRFIATDTPYIDMPMSKLFWGNDFLSREQTFILSPRVAIKALYPKSTHGKQLVRQDISNNELLIKHINCTCLMNSIKFGFHQNRQLLEELNQYITLMHKFQSSQNHT